MSDKASQVTGKKKSITENNLTYSLFNPYLYHEAKVNIHLYEGMLIRRQHTDQSKLRILVDLIKNNEYKDITSHLIYNSFHLSTEEEKNGIWEDILEFREISKADIEKYRENYKSTCLNELLFRSNSINDPEKKLEYLREHDYKDSFSTQLKVQSFEVIADSDDDKLMSSGVHAPLEFIDRTSPINEYINGQLCCFTGDTEVYTDKGPVRFDELTRRFNEGEKFLTLSYHEGETILTKICNVFETKEVTELLEVELDNGSVFRCTPDHKVLTLNRGYVEMQDLTEDDELISIEDKYLKEYDLKDFYENPDRYSDIINHRDKYVYKITNTNNGMSYVGESKSSLSHRFFECSYYDSHFKVMLRDDLKPYVINHLKYIHMRESGLGGFKLSIYPWVDENSEKYLIESTNSLYPNGYNVSKDGKFKGNGLVPGFKRMSKGSRFYYIHESLVDVAKSHGLVEGLTDSLKRTCKLHLLKSSDGTLYRCSPEDLDEELSKGSTLYQNELMRNWRVGKVSIRKDRTFKLVPEDQIEQFESDGWEVASPLSGKIEMNNGSRTRFVYPDQVVSLESEGYVVGSINAWGNLIKRKFITNGNQIRNIPIEDEIPDGWRLGKGYTEGHRIRMGRDKESGKGFYTPGLQFRNGHLVAEKHRQNGTGFFNKEFLRKSWDILAEKKIGACHNPELRDISRNLALESLKNRRGLKCLEILNLLKDVDESSFNKVKSDLICQNPEDKKRYSTYKWFLNNVEFVNSLRK